ncbi:MAG: hypothetical protein K9J82_02580 [Methylotenera sp.]|jgi:hypothetical protein|nr:hypothetical protein [Methylotenera sp.]
MKRFRGAVAALVAMGWMPQVLAAPSVCARLAEDMRQAPASVWSQADPQSGWIRPVAAAVASPVAEALSRDARWRDAVGAMSEQPLEVQQLPGAPLYLLSSYGGTANCQTVVLVQAQPGSAARSVPLPVPLKGQTLCVTQSASLAQVLGQPAFVVGGAPSMDSPDLRYRIASWTGGAWGGRCSLEIKRQTAMVAGQRFCRPGSPVCDQAHDAAQRLAKAYEASRARRQPLDAVALNDGRRPDAAVTAALGGAAPGARGESSDLNPLFALFGADERRLDAMLTQFSNADPRAVPLWVQGRWWLAFVGRSGVGWREGDAVLVSLYAPPGREADAVASYQFVVRPTGLASVVARDE